jgi:hypothetical protein
LNQILYSLCGFGEYAKSGICINITNSNPKTKLTNSIKLYRIKKANRIKDFFDLMIMPIWGGFLQR